MKRMAEKKQTENLLEMKPLHNIQWEKGENNIVVLLLPRFKNKYLVQWLLPRLKNPNIHLKLDERGSFVWELCDGTKSVIEIVHLMAEKFHEDVEHLYKRTGFFVQQLVREKFVVLKS
jgi:hypothetical protein